MKYKKLPLVSIGLPVYNSEKYLDQCLTSLLNQDYPNFELIISDNASTDQTATICQKYYKQDSRIRYYHQRKNIGAINNFNFVLSKAKGKYFMWGGADDHWHKHYLKYLVNFLTKNSQYDLVASEYIYFSDKTKSARKIEQPEFTKYPRIKSILTFLHNGLSLINDVLYYGLIKTKLLKELGGHIVDRRRRYVNYLNNDIYSTYYWLIKGIRFAIIPKILFYKRDSSINLDVYQEMKSVNISGTVMKKGLRYLFIFPLVFMYDSIIFIILAIKSNFNSQEKTIIIFYIIRNTINRFYLHYLAIFNVFRYLMKGVVVKFFS